MKVENSIKIIIEKVGQNFYIVIILIHCNYYCDEMISALFEIALRNSIAD